MKAARASAANPAAAGAGRGCESTLAKPSIKGARGLVVLGEQASMPWGDEQERLTQEARLSVASPEEVLRELKRIAQKPRIELFGRDEAIEALLVERNEPLINLGLACYGTSKEVFTVLYKHGLEKPADATDERYKRGLRIGCLSNTSVPAAHSGVDFPRDLIGPEEIHRVLAAGEDAEAEALICNPSISDKLLEELYTRTGAFAALAEERWSKLVYLSRKNKRLVTKEDFVDMPDTGHYAIHRAIFQSLETAPVTKRWLQVLYALLNTLDFQQVAHPEKIESVLARWAQLDDSGYKGEPMEGYITLLSLKDEFRCLVAALYGCTWSNNKLTVQGSPSSADVAMRCAYYGNAELSARQMKAGYNRDGSEYVFAAMYNNNVLSNNKLRKFFEQEQLTFQSDDLLRRYLRNFELKRKKWPFLESFLSSDARAEGATGKEDSRLEATSMTPQDERTMERAVERGLHTALHRFTAQVLNSVPKVMFVLVGVYLVYKYGLDVLGFLVAGLYMVGHAVGIW
jgi:hypothetical protein